MRHVRKGVQTEGTLVEAPADPQANRAGLIRADVLGLRNYGQYCIEFRNRTSRLVCDFCKLKLVLFIRRANTILQTEIAGYIYV